MSVLPPLPSRDQLLQMTQAQAIDLLLDYIAGLGSIVEQLQTRLAIDSTTSSKPPSSDLLSKPEIQKTPPDQTDQVSRKPGGQKGHEGSTRKGFGKPDRFEAVSLAACPRCGSHQLYTLKHQTRQVACLAERPIEIVQFERPLCLCRACQTTSTPPWPARVVGQSDIDSHLSSLLVWLGHYGHLSYDKLAELVEMLCGRRPSLGTLDSLSTRLGGTLRPPVEQAKAWLADQPVVYCDETPWLVGGTKEWLWGSLGQRPWQFGTEQVAIFHAGGSRSRAELVACLGETFAGTLVSDDFSVYNGYPAQFQQRCLAHLRRHFKKLSLRLAEPVGIGEAFIKLIDEVFTRYRHYQSDLDTETIRQWGEAFIGRIADAIKTWFPKAAAEGRKLLQSLQDRPEQWWQCLSNPAVRPDNNLSERNLRLGVTKRKVSGGSRSMSGFKRTAILLSVIQSCRRQGRSAVDFMRQALEAQQMGVILPSLIPTQST